MAIKKLKLIFKQATEIAPQVLSLRFNYQYANSETPEIPHEQPFDFIPGQFITLLINHPDGIKRRSYSIANMHHTTNEIELVISYVTKGIASDILFNLEPKQVINAIGPAGKLILQDDPEYSRYLLIGTGTGVAPYRAMIPQLKKRLEQDPNLSIEVIFGTRTQADLFYAQDFFFDKKL